MKKLKEAVNEIKYGSILTINKEDCPKTETQYASCLMVYDGTIFRDVKEVELGDFIKEVPNIQKKLDKGYVCKINYLYEEDRYQSSIIKHISEERIKEETVSNFTVLSDNFMDSIIKLDTMIANTYKNGKSLVKKAMRA